MSAPPAEAAPLGLLGGTFDPIHLGHLRLAEEAHEALGLAGVRFLPAGDPPHRAAPLSAAAHRLEMVRRATAGNPAFVVDDGEVRAHGKSYTVLTLERLRAELGPARPLVLIVGADAFEGLPGWHRWHELFALAHIAVANRPGTAPHGRRWPGVLSAALDAACSTRIDTDPACLRAAPAGRIVPFDMTPLAISASLVRNLIHDGRSARYLLPDSVLDYIGLQHLYR
jgi:nicotinate-nucleotide adenylyltransferase